jgi:tetratricopeptide (TPR) repeat protein
VAVVYAGVVFIIFQVADFAFPALHVPDWFSGAVVVLLALGFLVAVGLAWAFDITEKGVVKTPPKKEAVETRDSPPIVIGNKTLAIVAVLAIAVAIWSWWQIRQNPLSAFEHSVVVMPFDNLTDDPHFDVWGKGVASLIIDELTVYEELYVLDSQTLFEIINTIEQTRKAQVLPQLAREVADRTRIRTLLLGDILKAGSTLLLQARLMDARTGQVTFSHQVEGGSEDDLLIMARSLAERVRNHLEIGVIEKELAVGLRAPRVRSAKAYRLYVQGLEDFWMLRYPPAIEALQQAVALDSLLGPAYIILIYAYANTGMIDSARALFERTYPRKGQFAWDWGQYFDYERANQAKDIREAIRLLEQILARKPLFRAGWYQLGWTYYLYNKHEKVINSLEKSLELSDRWGGFKWVWLYTLLGYAYHQTGRHSKELKVYKRGLELLPEHPEILWRYAIHYLSVGDTARAAPYLEQYQRKREEEGWSEALILNGVGNIYWDAGLLTQAIGSYQQTNKADPAFHWPYSNMGFILIDNDMDVAEGLRLIEAALDLSPENPSHLHRKGWGLYKQGRYEEALALLERSWELRPSYDHDHYQHLQAAQKAVERQ